jgi:hypothetical protein
MKKAACLRPRWRLDLASFIELDVDVRKLFSDSNVKSLKFQVNILAQHYYQKTIDLADQVTFTLRSLAGRAKRFIIN